MLKGVPADKALDTEILAYGGYGGSYPLENWGKTSQEQERKLLLEP